MMNSAVHPDTFTEIDYCLLASRTPDARHHSSSEVDFLEYHLHFMSPIQTTPYLSPFNPYKSTPT